MDIEILEPSKIIYPLEDMTVAMYQKLMVPDLPQSLLADLLGIQDIQPSNL
jgi:hypothetical protein